jgi:hypothetical protein
VRALFTALAVAAVVLTVLVLLGVVFVRALRRLVRTVWPHS